MTPEQIHDVQQSFRKVQPIADQAGALFYGRLFELDPTLRPLFKGDMAEQARKLMKALATVAHNLNQPDSVMPTVEALGIRHVRYGVVDEHYDTVGDALLWTLGQGLGDEFTAEVRASWVAAYSMIAATMKRAARDAASRTAHDTPELPQDPMKGISA